MTLRTDIQFIHVVPALICFCGIALMIIGKKKKIETLEHIGMILPWFGCLLAFHVC